jgi:predicted Fe-Mo cluster-binding NifX family protein
MKIAAITEDSKTISRHFGRAPYSLVVTIHDQKIVDIEAAVMALLSGQIIDHVERLH